MAEISKKEEFKILIREFHTQALPETFARDLIVPLTSKKIIAVYGPRRSGKSFYFYTLIQALIKHGIAKERILYISFEDDRILPMAAGQFNALMEAYFELYPDNKKEEIFLFFDEIQNIKDWEIFVRRIHDKEKAKIFLTGSSSKLLFKEVATALRGRAIGYALYPLNFREFLRFNGLHITKDSMHGPERFQIKKSLEDYLEYGGFPEVVLEKNAMIKDRILEEYFESLVYRDLVERHSIDNTELLKDLLKHLFSNITSLFSVNAYHKSAKKLFSVSRETITNYLKFIQDTGYVTLLPKFSWSTKEQKVNPQKIICLDLGIRNRIAFRFSKDEGKAVENLVGAQFIARGSKIYYWEDKKEVDFVIQSTQKLSGVNVTYGSVIHDREIDSLAAFKKHYSRASDLILVTKDTENRTDLAHSIPLWKWLLD